MNMTTIRVSLKMFDMNTMEIVDKQVDLPDRKSTRLNSSHRT